MNEPKSRVLDYGLADSDTTRFLRLLPRPSWQTLLLLALAIAAHLWFWSDKHPWVPVHSYSGGYWWLDGCTTADGRKILLGTPQPYTDSSHGPFRVTDVVTGQTICTFGNARDSARPESFSADGSRVVTIRDGNDLETGLSVQLWDASKGTKIADLPPVHQFMPGQWKPIQFSPDGSRLVTLYDRQAILYETSRGQFIAVLQQNPRQDGDNLSGARFSADSTRIVISSSVRTSFYSAADGHAFPQRKGDSPTMGTPASGMGGTFATRGSAVAAFDGCIKLMEDKPEWRWLPAAQTGTDIADFRFTPDGNSLIIWHLNGTATRLGLRDGSHGNTNAPPLDRTAAPSRFSADGTRVCLSPDPNGGSSVQVLTKSNQQIEGTIAPSPEPFTYARFVTGTDLILTLNNAGTAQLWKYPRPPSVWDWIVVPKFCLMLATSTALLVSIRRDAREGRYRLRFPAADRRANWKMRYLVGITAIASLHLLGTLAFVISEAAPGRDNLLWVGVGPDGGHEPSAFAIRLANLYELPILNVFVQNQGGWYPDVQFIISSALNAAIWGLGCIALWQAITALRRSSAP